MKKIILSLFVALMGSLCYAQGGLEGVIVEEVDASTAGEGQISYRVFVDLEPGYELQQIRGNTANPLHISTTTAWFNSGFGAEFGHVINAAFISVFPELAYDSYVSLGGATSTEWGVLTTDDPSGRLALGPVNAVSTLGTIDVAGNFGLAPTLNSLVADEDGQFFTLTTNADIAPENRIYIGQFTTDGDFSFEINIQTRVAGTNNFTVLNATDNPALIYPTDPGGDEGCTDPIACNFDPLATVDDGSCILPLDCDDADACTTDSGECDPDGCINTPIDCDDGDACTTDSCDPATGCVYTAVDCDDGDACTDDACDSSDGCINTPIDCDDGDACTTDSCDPATGCVNTPIDCDDGDACTTDSCEEGACVNTPIDCNDEDACTTDSCEEGACVNTPIDCDDGDPTTTDTCVDGECMNIVEVCNDDDACTTDALDPDSGECVFTAIDCDDGDACTTDSCDSATGCVNTPIDCDDGDACTTDSCEEGACVNTPIDCDDGDACTTDSCEEGACVNTPIDCDDGDPNTTDSCVNGECINEPPTPCNDDDACTTDALDPETEECVFTPVDCDDGDACTTDSCDPATGCVYTDVDCDDGDACTTDSCDSSDGCINTPIDCDDGDACTIDSCDPATGCVNTAIDCDDNDPTTADSCVDGECINEPIEPGDCEDVDPSIWGMGPWTTVTEGSFVAESANDAVLAKGDGDLTVEIFSGSCAGTSLGDFNTVSGDGEIERIVVGDLVAGETYYYSVTGGTNIMSKVKTYADSRLEDFDCNVDQALIDQIYALREETMYSNPAVQVTGFAFRFVDEDTAEVIELVDNAVDGFYQQLVTIPGIQNGHTYSVTVRHSVLQIANGMVTNLWSDYGTACTVNVTDGEGFANDDIAESSISNNTPLKAVIYPNPNNGDQVYLKLIDFDQVDSDVIVTIVDMYGKQIHMEQFASSANDSQRVITFNQNLSAGMYFVNLTVNERVITQKLIVQ